MANRFWVGGTGNLDGVTTTHIAATSGAAGGASYPGSGDTLTFDGASGGGTVTVTADHTLQSITCGAFTGTLDWSANNKNVTLNTAAGFSGSGTGTRTINLGNGTWTFNSTTAGTPWDMGTTTGLTFSANSSVLDFTGDIASGGQKLLIPGALSYSTILLRAQTAGGTAQINGTNTIVTLTVTGTNFVVLGGSNTITTLSLNGTLANPIGIQSSALATARTLTVASNAPTMTGVAFRSITGAGGATFAATNSFDLGRNSGITITAPAAAGGGIRVAGRGGLAAGA